MLVVGVTGGLGAGKTTFAQMLAEMGADIIDVDRMAHGLLEPGTKEYHQLVREFGQQILDAQGQIDRKILGRSAFENADQVRKLNSIVHPRLLRRLRDTIRRARNKQGGILVIDAALLFEWELEDDLDLVIDVEADPGIRIQRAKARGVDDMGALRKRIRAQLPSAERMRRADIVIQNQQGLEHLRGQARRIWTELKRQQSQKEA